MRPWHAFWRSRPGTLVWRVGVGLIGALLVLGGVALLPLPGPGWLVIFVGLAVLGVEFAWARGLLVFARARVSQWSSWVSAQPLPVRAAIGGACLALVAGVALVVAWVFGVPSWVPTSITDPLVALLPPSP